MNKQSFAFEIKSLDEAAGIFEGYASTFGNTDLGDDIVEAGAFTKSIEASPNVPLLWSHDQSLPIGAIRSMTQDEKGLKVTGELCLETVKGREAYALLKRNMLKGLSIGYRVIADAVENGKRLLKELSLIEISLTPTPMNQLALVTTVKASQIEPGIITGSQIGSVNGQLVTPFKMTDFLQRIEALETLVKTIVTEWKGKETQNINTERNEAAVVADFFRELKN